MRHMIITVVLVVLVALDETAAAQDIDMETYSDPETYVASGQERDPTVDVTRSPWSVEEVALAVCAYSHQRDDGTGRCDDYCAPDRSGCDICPYLPDRQDHVMSDEECAAFASEVVYRSLVLAGWPGEDDDYLEDVAFWIEAGITVAIHESSIQVYAMGHAAECGSFQQQTQYAQPEDMRLAMGCTNAGRRNGCDLDDRVRICRWLQARPENQVFAFYANVGRDAGADWLCRYHDRSACDDAGSNGSRYESSVLGAIGTTRRALRRAREIIEENLDGEGDGG